MPRPIRPDASLSSGVAVDLRTTLQSLGSLFGALAGLPLFWLCRGSFPTLHWWATIIPLVSTVTLWTTGGLVGARLQPYQARVGVGERSWQSIYRLVGATVGALIGWGTFGPPNMPETLAVAGSALFLFWVGGLIGARLDRRRRLR